MQNSKDFKPSYIGSALLLIILSTISWFVSSFIPLRLSLQIVSGIGIFLFLCVITLQVVIALNPARNIILYSFNYVLSKLIKDVWFMIPFFGKVFKVKLFRLLGAKIGHGTMLFGEILDPHLVKIGVGCIIGHDAVITAHSVENGKVITDEIIIGDNVTVGAKSIIFPGVVIGNDSIVCAGAIVLKGARIKSGEVWGGVPAKLIKSNG